jgi:hypothetical protein
MDPDLVDIDADEAALRGFGPLIDEPHDFPIEIVRWPAQGRRRAPTAPGAA